MVFSNVEKTKRKKKGGDSMYGIEVDKEFSNKSTYLIPLSEILHQIRKDSDVTTTFKFSADFVRFKKSGNIGLEYHKDVKAKYIACVVPSNFEFGKLIKRKFPIYEGNKETTYFIPISFIRSLINPEFTRSDSVVSELSEISIFKYTGEMEVLEESSIFSLSYKIYLARKLDDRDNIRISI